MYMNARERVTVVYNTETGDIRHVHQCVSSPQQDLPDEEEMEGDALRYAAEAGHDRPQLAVLHVDPARFKQNAAYKVDTRNRTLIEAPSE
jgi:hypothetical protein